MNVIVRCMVVTALSVLTFPGAAQERPRFEVATLKPAAPNAAPRNQIVPTSPNRLYIPSMTLSWLIYTAYVMEDSTPQCV